MHIIMKSWKELWARWCNSEVFLDTKHQTQLSNWTILRLESCHIGYQFPYWYSKVFSKVFAFFWGGGIIFSQSRFCITFSILTSTQVVPDYCYYLVLGAWPVTVQPFKQKTAYKWCCCLCHICSMAVELKTP